MIGLKWCKNNSVYGGAMWKLLLFEGQSEKHVNRFRVKWYQSNNIYRVIIK